MGASCANCADDNFANCAAAQSTPSCECALDGPTPEQTLLRVGCCAGLLDAAPIQMALSFGTFQGLCVKPQWVQCPPDAGAVGSMLSSGLLDMAVMETEDAVADAAQGNPLRICGTFVSSPRMWAIYVPTGSSIVSGSDLRGCTLGMPDEKAGSLAVSVFGECPDWVDVLFCPRRALTSIIMACDAMATGVMRAAVWECRAARHLVSAGEWIPVGHVPMPWPSLVLVASKDSLYAKAGAIRRFVHFAHTACEEFKTTKREDATRFCAARYAMSTEEVHEFISETQWVCQCEVDVETLGRPLAHLKKTGLVADDQADDPTGFIAKEVCMGDQTGVLSDSPPLAPLLQEDEDLDDGRMPDQPAAASLLSRVSEDSRSSSPLGRQLLSMAADQASRRWEANHEGPILSGVALPGFRFESCAARLPPATGPGRPGRVAELAEAAETASEADNINLSVVSKLMQQFTVLPAGDGGIKAPTSAATQKTPRGAQAPMQPCWSHPGVPAGCS